VFAAGARAIGVIDQNVVVARSANYAVHGFVELIVSQLGGMFGSRLLAAHGHGAAPSLHSN
jgi:hypothetical protein